MSKFKLASTRAEVAGGGVTVPARAQAAQGLEAELRTVRLLGDGEWGNVRLKKGAVKVSHDAPGTGDKLRHHLDALVAQANSAHERAEAPERPAETEQDEREWPEAEMTARFRAFAQAEGA
jgi:hypothetical protein